MKQLSRLLILVATLMPLAASAAEEKRRFESLWTEATAGEHALTDYGDYTMVDAGDVFWYFTKAGHPAHPGVVRRAIKQDNGRFFIDTQGWSFAATPGQPGFKRWLADFDALNRKLIEALQNRQ